MRLRREIHLGSWGIFCDISGQVTESPDNPIVTVAAVAVPREVLRPIRRRLVRVFDGAPTKWKVGGLTGLTRIVQLATSYPLQIAVLQIHRDTERWARFYAQATKFRATAREELRKPLRYLDGNEVMRMFLVGEAFAHALGRMLRARHPWGDRSAIVELELIVDTDLHEAETREQFKWALLDWTKNSHLHLDLDVSTRVTGRVETEQEEPLLLLPDYVAGVYHHADPRARLSRPIATPDAASGVIAHRRERLSLRLFEIAVDFNQEYPLDHNAGRVVQRRQPGD